MSHHLYMPDAKLTDIIEDYAWCKMMPLGAGCGTRTIAPDGFVFISLLQCAPLRNIRRKEGGETWFLYVKPTELAKAKAAPGCVSGRLNGIEFFQQVEDPDKFLVLASDASSIGNPWLTYITRDQLPTIEFIENVEEYRP